MRSWLARRWYDTTYWSALAGFTLGWSLRATGRRHMPLSGPALLVSNHQSFLDPPLIGLVSPRPYLTFLARQSLFRNRFLSGFFSSLGGIPIDHKGLGRAGLQATLDALERGEAVVVFPEGERTQDGRMHPFEPGVSLLVKRVKAPIVPIGLAGAYDAWSRHQMLPRPAPLFLAPGKGTLAVAIGKPLDPAPLAKLSRQEMLHTLFAAVAACAAEAERIRRKPKKN